MLPQENFSNWEIQRCHFPGFQGEFEAKKVVRPNPSNPPRSAVAKETLMGEEGDLGDAPFRVALS